MFVISDIPFNESDAVFFGVISGMLRFNGVNFNKNVDGIQFYHILESSDDVKKIQIAYILCKPKLFLSFLRQHHVITVFTHHSHKFNFPPRNSSLLRGFAGCTKNGLIKNKLEYMYLWRSSFLLAISFIVEQVKQMEQPQQQ